MSAIKQEKIWLAKLVKANAVADEASARASKLEEQNALLFARVAVLEAAALKPAKSKPKPKPKLKPKDDDSHRS
jgi:hypothetical protein